MEEVLRKVATAMGKVVARTADEENDMVEFEGPREHWELGVELWG